MKLRHIPNILGVYRIVTAVALIPLFLVILFGDHPFSSSSTLAIVTIIIFALGGFTDIIDGTIARSIKGGQSDVGATLDGIADMAMVIVSFVIFIPIMSVGGWVYPVFLAGLGFKIASGVFAQLKHKENSLLLHTYAMKLLGFLLFLTPILYFFAGPAAWFTGWLIFVIVTLVIVIVEEVLINVLLKGASQDIKTVFKVRSENEKILARKAEEVEEMVKQD
ncbi:MAG: CDP-alcohol phosphatidyltransferase family protein [Firmicutes bacterium]|nr:CDP-alcohol phosphatidyltransferase family protein [Bacillota bacterium]